MQHTTSNPTQSCRNLLFALLLLVLPFVAQPVAAHADGATAYTNSNGRNHNPETYDWSGDAVTPSEYDWSDD